MKPQCQFLLFLLSTIKQDAANLTELLKDITSVITLIEKNVSNNNNDNYINNQYTQFYSLLYYIQNNNTDQSLASQSSFISSTVSDVNSTCYKALANLTAQNVSIAGLMFDAELRNVGVYSSCVFEYLSNCSMPTNVFICTTDYHDVIVDVSIIIRVFYFVQQRLAS